MIGLTPLWAVAESVKDDSAPAAPTFAREVAPIIYRHCAVCHHEGQAAPFALTNFTQVQKRGRQIAEVTASRFMPPWKLTVSDFKLRHDRRLAPEQIDILQRWVAAGMPRGDAAQELPAPTFSSSWALGEPDLQVSMDAAFSVPADGPDVYRNFVLPLNQEEDHWVRAIDFRPGAPTVVHHSLFFFDTTGMARERDEQDETPGYRSRMGFLPTGRDRRGIASALNIAGDQEEAAPFGGLGGWAVGGNPQEFPDGLAMFLPKGADLVLSTHFHPSGKQEEERSTIGIYFAKSDPTNRFNALILPPLFGALAGLDIPAGVTNYSIGDTFTLPVDVKAFGLGAHAHYLGKELQMKATLPDGRTRILGWIQDWDFDWQERYRYDEEVSLPAGTVIEVSVRYDNSAGNVSNPSHPPQRVRWGEQSTDEMGSMTLLVVPVDKADHAVLQEAYRTHVRDGVRHRIRSGFQRLRGERNSP